MRTVESEDNGESVLDKEFIQTVKDWLVRSVVESLSLVINTQYAEEWARVATMAADEFL